MAYWRVKLPPGVRSPFEVYVNGVPQELGSDYRIASGELLFTRELVRQKLGAKAWLLGFWGIGTYKRNDEIDVRYELDGRPILAHALEVSRPRGQAEAAPASASRPAHGRSSFSADRIARVAGERLSV
jgi:hypothetical protein